MNRISIRGMAVASVVIAASTAVTLAVNGIGGGEEVVAEPAAATGPLPAKAEARAAQERASRSASRTPTFGGDARGIAANMAAEQYGWGAGQFSCLDSLWERESGWDHSATNPSSGAYGIPQALPGSKMSSYGSDWRTDPVTQIQWGLAYIESSHGTPCGAWSTFQSEGSY